MYEMKIKSLRLRLGRVRKKAVSRPPIGSVPVKHLVSELITTLERKKKWDNIGAFSAHIAILDLY